MNKLFLLFILIIVLFGLGFNTVQASNCSAADWLPWENRPQIQQWIRDTGIPDRQFVPDFYDCDNFAFDLFYQGYFDRRLIGLLLEVKTDSYGAVIDAHMTNFTINGNYIVKIDPQTGYIRELLLIDRRPIDK